MLQAGKSITQKDDPLVKVQLEYLYKAVTDPKPAIENQINRLRNVLAVNPERYNELKRQLPYVVGGIFSPPIRRSENFAWIKYFIIDIDHLASKEMNIERLQEKLAADNRVFLAFRSPGNDGLKVIFALNEKCSDAQKYSLFYRVFAESISRQYNLDQVIDKRTSDVTRACFISVDPAAFYNPDAESIDMQAFINFENHEEVKQAKMLMEERSGNAPEIKKDKPDNSLPDESIEKIKRLLNPNIRIRPAKKIFVPEELSQAISHVETHLKEFDLKLGSINDIHYGKQLRIESDTKWAEINLFYGKRGFTLVKTSKSQSNEELCDLAHKILCQLFIPQDE